MKEKFKNRLDALNPEFESGQKELADLEAKETDLRITLSE